MKPVEPILKTDLASPMDRTTAIPQACPDPNRGGGKKRSLSAQATRLPNAQVDD